MARPIKKGLDYFPFDIDFFSDIRIRKLVKYQGGKSTSVYACLLCNIYKIGYYLVWDDELPFIISEQTGCEEAYIREVINSCLNIGLFSKELWEKKKVLTSKGIQIRYDEISKLIKRRAIIDEFSLVITEETGVITELTSVSSEETRVITEETGVSSGFSTQRKEKEIKEKEIKGNNNIDVSIYLDSFNSIRKTKFRATAKVKSQFNARIKEGYSIDDMIIALRNAMKDKYHISEGYRHLTAEFFTRSDKIDKFLNSIPKSDSRCSWEITTTGDKRTGSYSQYELDIKRFGENNVNFISYGN